MFVYNKWRERKRLLIKENSNFNQAQKYNNKIGRETYLVFVVGQEHQQPMTGM